MTNRSTHLDLSASAMLELVAPTVLEVRAANRGLGTGIAWGSQRVLTNAHVVHKAKKLEVINRAGRTWSAQVVREDAALDLAVLEVPGLEGPSAAIGDPQRLRVGELVFAIGHPLGEKWLATAGVLSGRSAPLSGTNAHLEYLLSDVRLAPGNSGGPLFNASGEVIGMNSMVLAPRNGFAARGSGIAMAIPGDVAHAWAWDGAPKLGISVQTLPPSNKQPLRLIVSGLEFDGAAARGGLQIGDVLLESRGRQIKTSGALLTVISNAGSHLPLRVLRGEHVVQLEIPLFERVTAA
jgi:serine protease Do